MRKSPFSENHFLNATNPTLQQIFYRYWRNQATKVLSRLLLYVKRFSSAAANANGGTCARERTSIARARFPQSRHNNESSPKGRWFGLQNLSFF